MSDTMSILFYLGGFSLSALLLGFGIKKKLKIVIFFALIIPVLMAAYRFGVGTDYNSYLQIYEDMNTYSLTGYFLDNPNMIEAGFFGIIKLAAILNGGPILMFGIAASLTILFTYLGVIKSKVSNPATTFFLYLLIIFPLSLNGVRQGIAMSIFFYAFTFALDKKWLKFVLFTLFASLFHVSVLLMLPVYFIAKYTNSNQKIDRVKMLGGMAIALVVSLVIMPVILNAVLSIGAFEKYAKYITSDVATGYGIYVLGLLVTVLAVVFSKKLIKYDKNMKIYILLSILSVIIATLGLEAASIYRQSLYLAIYPLIIISTYVNVFNDKFGKRLAYAATIGYAIGYFIIIYGLYNLGDVLPYNVSIGG